MRTVRPRVQRVPRTHARRLVMGVVAFISVCCWAGQRAAAGDTRWAGKAVDLVLRPEVVSAFLGRRGCADDVKQRCVLLARMQGDSIRAFDEEARTRLLSVGLAELEEESSRRMRAAAQKSQTIEEEEVQRSDAMARYVVERVRIQREADERLRQLLEHIGIEAKLDAGAMRELEGDALADCFLSGPADAHQPMQIKLDLFPVVRDALTDVDALASLPQLRGSAGEALLDRVLDQYRIERDEALRLDLAKRRRVPADPSIVYLTHTDPEWGKVMRERAAILRAYWRAVSNARDGITRVLEDAGLPEASAAWREYFARRAFPGNFKPRAVDEMLAFLNAKRDSLIDGEREACDRVAAEWTRNRIARELESAAAFERAFLARGSPNRIDEDIDRSDRLLARASLAVHALSRETIDALLAGLPRMKRELEDIALRDASIERFGPPFDRDTIIDMGAEAQADELPDRARRYAAHSSEREIGHAK
jgi:hypothetical protein